MVKNDVELYPFHKANVHERRFAAAVFRALPLYIFCATCVVLVLGAFQNELLLLIVSAVLNLAMWLWIVSTSLFGMAGAWKVMTEVEAKAKELAAKSESPEAPLPDALCDSIDTDGVVHMIVIPNYKEDESILSETLTCLAEAEDSKSFHVVLAMESREGENGESKAMRLQEKFSSSFGDIFITSHPTDLNEEHLDDSIDLEVPGKASNLKWAVQSAYQRISKLGLPSINNVLLTVADADCLFHPCYFSSITKDYNGLREKPPTCGMKQHQWCMWQAPQLSYRDHWNAPLCSRAWTYVSSMYEFGGTSSLHWGGHHMVFSGYTLPLQLACNAQSWDGDVIAEDHHAYLKCLFYSAYYSASQPTTSYDSLFGDGCQPLLQVRPVFLPVKSSPVISSEGYWQTYVERWNQAKRHAQGVAELPYALLVCWDLCCTLPLSSWSFHLIYKMGRALTRLFCMHILPTCQAVALATMTIYWLFMRRNVKNCPNDLTFLDLQPRYALCGCAGAWTLMWPMIVPLACVVFANFLFLLTAFLQPASLNNAKKYLWHGEDGAIEKVGGSKKVASFMMIGIDCMAFLSIIMVPYGLIAVLLAYWNVCFHGNRFKYITAAKAAKMGADYGSMSESP